MPKWKSTLPTAAGDRQIIDLTKAGESFPRLRHAPRIIQIFAENVLRHCAEDPEAEMTALLSGKKCFTFRPHRLVLQDVAGLPTLLDIAGLRSLAAEQGSPPEAVRLACEADLVVDHSIRAAFTGSGSSARNLEVEYRENHERFTFLRWAQTAFDKLRVVPPGNGIIHQINLESLSSATVMSDSWVFPDTLLGTDSHTPMINGLGVLGWGVGGIEASAVLLGNPLSIISPNVVGVRLVGSPVAGVLATDVALRLCERLRDENVVDCFLEFFGPGAQSMSVQDRASLSNMTPEYGATCSLFPVDESTIAYLAETGRTLSAALSKDYWMRQRMFGTDAHERTYERTIEFDVGAVRTTVAGPFLPHQARSLSQIPSTVQTTAQCGRLQDGDVVIAAIASCTNTSNPEAMIAAGLLARNALLCGLRVDNHIKASFSPGSKAVPAYLDALGLLQPLQEVGFWVAGYGCMTCVGNSGDLAPEISEAITTGRLNVASISSGNRNFEGRIHPLVRSNYLASPPIVIAYALAGNIRGDISKWSTKGQNGSTVTLADLWPTQKELSDSMRSLLFQTSLSARDTKWEALDYPKSSLFPWKSQSTYLVRPKVPTTFPKSSTLERSRILLHLGDNVTTDHISPVGRIALESPAGQYLKSLGVPPQEFSTYGARRGNFEVMQRGTFANARLRNSLAGDREGWWTRHYPSGDILSIFDAIERYKATATSLVIVAGSLYGVGSARDWAAKGTAALGVRAVLAHSFERIHRTNLALVGVLPLEWTKRPQLEGDETLEILLEPAEMEPQAVLQIEVRRHSKPIGKFDVTCRLDTPFEVDCWKQGGFLARAALALNARPRIDSELGH